MRKLVLVLLLVACGHSQAGPAAKRSAKVQAGTPGDARRPPRGADSAATLSDEAHLLSRRQADLVWRRWTTGEGPLPSGLVAQFPALTYPDSPRTAADAAARASGEEAAALRLLSAQLAGLAIAQQTAAETEALDRARAQLSYAAPGDAHGDRGERDLDKLLNGEPDAKKRFAIASAEAQAARPLASLVLARDAATERAIASLGLGSWSDLQERIHRIPPVDLAVLAERTLAATEVVAARAVDEAASINLGTTRDRLRRADLPRLVRSSSADGEFPAGQAWEQVKLTFGAVGLDVPGVKVDAEPVPSKGARPLALLVDPPADVRLSLRSLGGYEEQRAALHEGARAAGGKLVDARHWELAQLGEGSAAEGVAQLFEELAAEPEWLRERTKLRGEPLDDLVHAQAARRLLAARRAAALVLFEIRRRSGQPSAEAQAALYRGLLQRATFAVLSDDDANRWALEADTGIRAAPALLGALLAAHLEEKLARPGQPWWKSPAGETLRPIWAGGRSFTAAEAAKTFGVAALDPEVLARIADRRLSYQAPERPPPTSKPDYRYMQGDRKKRRARKK